MQNQLQIAAKLGLNHIDLVVSSDQIESLFGLARLHGTGEIKDTHRIALRRPALCGTTTLARGGAGDEDQRRRRAAPGEYGSGGFHGLPATREVAGFY